jgi:hypothetical protein
MRNPYVDFQSLVDKVVSKLMILNYYYRSVTILGYIVRTRKRELGGAHSRSIIMINLARMGANM